MRDRGIVLEIERDVAGDRAGRRRAARCRLDNGETHLVDQVLFATGRAPEHRGARARGARASGSRRTARSRSTHWSQTAVPSIYAVGDVTDRLALTPVAIARGPGLRRDGVRRRGRGRSDHSLIPTAVFTQPEAATVGLTEAEARAARAGRDLPRRASGRCSNTLAGRDERMLMKLVVDARQPQGARRATSSAPGAAEMIQLAAVALRMGATKEDFDAHDGGASDRRRGAGHDAGTGPR